MVGEGRELYTSSEFHRRQSDRNEFVVLCILVVKQKSENLSRQKPGSDLSALSSNYMTKYRQRVLI